MPDSDPLAQEIASRMRVMSPDQEKLRTMWGNPAINPQMVSPGDGLPPVPTHAPAFRPEPLVIGGQGRLARLVDELLKIAPENRGNVNQIRMGPTEEAFGSMAQRGLPSDRKFDETSLMGVFGPQSHNIGVNAGQSEKELLNTVIHEMTHAAGYNEEYSRNAEGILSDATKNNILAHMRKAR